MLKDLINHIKNLLIIIETQGNSRTLKKIQQALIWVEALSEQDFPNYQDMHSIALIMGCLATIINNVNQKKIAGNLTELDLAEQTKQYYLSYLAKIFPIQAHFSSTYAIFEQFSWAWPCLDYLANGQVALPSSTTFVQRNQEVIECLWLVHGATIPHLTPPILKAVSDLNIKQVQLYMGEYIKNLETLSSIYPMESNIPFFNHLLMYSNSLYHPVTQLIDHYRYRPWIIEPSTDLYLGYQYKINMGHIPSSDSSESEDEATQAYTPLFKPTKIAPHIFLQEVKKRDIKKEF